MPSPEGIGNQVGGRSLVAAQFPHRALARRLLSLTVLRSGVPIAVAIAVLGLGTACDSSSRAVTSDGGTSCAIKYRFQTSVNRQLDMLFVVEDSPAMAAQQAKLARELPKLMRVLQALPGGLPDIHVGVVSSSMGAGRFDNVPGCLPDGPGNNAGRFMHAAACTALAPGQSFLIANRDITNFTGDIADVFACLANLGSNGCGFSQPLAAMRLALEKANRPLDPDNGGFLRPDAYLAIVVLTAQDDCSVPPDSDLFDPAQMTLADPYGGLHAYRCSEFGHLCDGRAPPHEAPPAGETLTLGNCTPAEGAGRLSPVAELVEFLGRLKASPSMVQVAGVAGPVTPYGIGAREFQTGTDMGNTERQPVAEHACTGPDGEHADSAVRLKAWLDAFGSNAVLHSACANDLLPALARVAQVTPRSFGPRCISGDVATTSDGQPDCQAARRLLGDSGGFIDLRLPLCDSHQANFPCWRLQSRDYCVDGQELEICQDPTCDPRNTVGGREDVILTCALRPPC